MADYDTATNPQTGERVVQIGGEWKPFDASATNPKNGAKAFKVGGQWVSGPPAMPETLSQRMTDVISEPLAHFATGLLSTPAAGLAGAGAAAEGNPNPGGVVQDVQSAFTYQPRSAAGQAVTGVVETPFRKLAQYGDVAGQKVSNATESALRGAGVQEDTARKAGATAGAVTNTAVQSVPALIGKGAGMLRGAGADAAASGGAGAANTAAEAAARAYVSRTTSLDWDSLSGRLRQALTTIAKDAKTLDKLDPKAVERQARLEKLGLPATRGQVTRDLSQLTREETLTKTDAGADIRGINAEQDKVLHQHLDTLRGQTGGTATTRTQVGESVQNKALRAKESESKDNYRDLYKKARQTEPNAEVSADPLYAFLDSNPEVQHLGFLKSWLDRGKVEKTEKAGGQATTTRRGVTLSELDDLRKKAGGIARAGGTDGYYASEVVKAIDASMEDVPNAAKAWKKAISAFKAHKTEFEEQGAVERLVGDKSRTDRNVALEDTFDRTVVKGSNEDLVKVRDSLLKGGKPETLAAGQQAWRDLQAATIDYLKDAAAGKRAIPGENNQLQFNSSFLDALYDLDKDGKLDTLFGEQNAAHIRELAEATRDVRTKPTGRIAGSDTAPRILNFLEKLAAVPVVGKYAAGVAKAGQKLASMGSETREAGRAKTSPITDAEKESGRAADQTARRTRTLESLKRNAPAAPLTLEGEQQ